MDIELYCHEHNGLVERVDAFKLGLPSSTSRSWPSVHACPTSVTSSIHAVTIVWMTENHFQLAIQNQIYQTLSFEFVDILTMVFQQIWIKFR